jgi:hypothetical protein
MRFLDEFRQKPITLADHLPWAALVAPGVLLNKDGSFSACVKFRGPDLESSTPEEMMAVRARLNNMLKRLGTGWCFHMEARRRQADPYPDQSPINPAACLIDEGRKAHFEQAGTAFETDHFATFTWLPPADDVRKAENFLFQNRSSDARDWHESLALFEREIRILVDLMADGLPEARLITDEELLTYLHATISPKDHPVLVPETPVFLDAQLADTTLYGGLALSLAISICASSVFAPFLVGPYRVSWMGLANYPFPIVGWRVGLVWIRPTLKLSSSALESAGLPSVRGWVRFCAKPSPRKMFHFSTAMRRSRPTNVMARLKHLVRKYVLMAGLH